MGLWAEMLPRRNNATSPEDKILDIWLELLGFKCYNLKIHARIQQKAGITNPDGNLFIFIEIIQYSGIVRPYYI